ncbi:hypothetical protein EVAR_40514_1 [Eumeta japonica]|uniref:Uncharacterized protein n=1 Tax=Eumeta variegata TaxID=151549 RepID=A0A4C1XXB0_EUMVA|nr:hypothetical protein EVAR_40514_1 [Eumeta japonica]
MRLRRIDKFFITAEPTRSHTLPQSEDNKQIQRNILINLELPRKDKKVNASKTKVMGLERGESTTECDMYIEGEGVEQVEEFDYLGSLFINDREHD